MQWGALHALHQAVWTLAPRSPPPATPARACCQLAGTPSPSAATQPKTKAASLRDNRGRLLVGAGVQVTARSNPRSHHCRQPPSLITHAAPRCHHARMRCIGCRHACPGRAARSPRTKAADAGRLRRCTLLGGLHLLQAKVVGGHARIVLGVEAHHHGVQDTGLRVWACVGAHGLRRGALHGGRGEPSARRLLVWAGAGCWLCCPSRACGSTSCVHAAGGQAGITSGWEAPPPALHHARTWSTATTLPVWLYQ